jgi:hypothetical protein
VQQDGVVAIPLQDGNAGAANDAVPAKPAPQYVNAVAEFTPTPCAILEDDCWLIASPDRVVFDDIVYEIGLRVANTHRQFPLPYM